MLASIAGSQGTGKSTLLAALADLYPQISRKTSRSILSDWGVSLSEVNNNRELTLKFQDEILARKIADEADAVASDKWHLTERTYADLFTYALVAIGKDNEYSDWIDEYYHKCVAAQATYREVFFLTAGHFAPVNDGVRGANKHYSRMVDRVMFDYTKEMFPAMITIDTPDLEKRQDIVYNQLEDLHPITIVATYTENYPF